MAVLLNPLRPSDAYMLTIIASDNGLSPGRRQAIIWTNAGILLIRTLGTNFREILGEIHSFSFSKMHLKMSYAKWRLFGLGLNELKEESIRIHKNPLPVKIVIILKRGDPDRLANICPVLLSGSLDATEESAYHWLPLH